MNPVLVLELKVHVFIIWVNVCVSISSLTNTLNHGDVALGKPHVLIVELVEDLGPPLLVVLALNKLFELILFRQLADSLTLDRVASMLVQIVPVLWHIACADQDFFV